PGRNHRRRDRRDRPRPVLRHDAGGHGGRGDHGRPGRERRRRRTRHAARAPGWARRPRPESPPAGAPASPPADLNNRGRRSVGVDLKNPDGVAVVLDLVERADALIEGFRPGVAERLGIGPEECLARNPKLVYGRMTGWGQDGPLAGAAGHDINYIALAGALDPIGRRGEAPVPPLNLVGDYGGGGMLLAFGVVCGVLEAQRSGQGQAVGAAVGDRAAVLMTMTHAL